MLLFNQAFNFLRRQVAASSSNIRFAVAFWGNGASEQLGLLQKVGSTARFEVICNLRLGGTDPDEIEKMISSGIKVRHSDHLHAKVYRFDRIALVGSANASANGLGFEGREAHWAEACSVVDAEIDLKQLDIWFDDRWDDANEVTELDLETARRNRDRIRSRRPIFSDTVTEDSFFRMLESNSSSFAGRPVYLVCNANFYDLGQREWLERKDRLGPNVASYENWPEIPADAVLLDFNFMKRWKQPKFNKIFRTRMTVEPVGIGSHDLFLVDEVRKTNIGEFPFIFSKRSIEFELVRWRKLIRGIRDASPKTWEQHGGCAIRLDQVLAAEKGSLVLNVLDIKRRYRYNGDGTGVSGDWFRPDTAPGVVRIYQEKGGKSVAGGTISKRIRSGDNTIIHFQPDATQIGLPYPGHFRANGCMVSLD